MKRLIGFFYFLVVSELLFTSPAYAGLCALCRRTLEMTNNAGLIKGFFLSVLVIAGVPLLIGGIVFFVFYSHRNKLPRQLT